MVFEFLRRLYKHEPLFIECENASRLDICRVWGRARGDGQASEPFQVKASNSDSIPALRVPPEPTPLVQKEAARLARAVRPDTRIREILQNFASPEGTARASTRGARARFARARALCALRAQVPTPTPRCGPGRSASSWDATPSNMQQNANLRTIRQKLRAKHGRKQGTATGASSFRKVPKA